MNLTDELERLSALHAQGRLSDDEYARAKARLLDAESAPPPAVQAVNRFRRSRGDRWLAGVCGGIGAITGVESWLWRLVLAVLALFGGTGVVIYILLWMFVPEEGA